MLKTTSTSYSLPLGPIRHVQSRAVWPKFESEIRRFLPEIPGRLPRVAINNIDACATPLLKYLNPPREQVGQAQSVHTVHSVQCCKQTVSVAGLNFLITPYR